MESQDTHFVFESSWLASSCGGEFVHQPKDCSAIWHDTRTLAPGALYVALDGAQYNGHDFVNQAILLGAACALIEKRYLEQVLSRLSVPDFSLLVVDHSLVALQQLARAHRQRLNTRFLGVCGSNGKTSTKELCAAVLSSIGHTFHTHGNYNNHIGLPLSVLQVRPWHQFAVLEAGMNHLGELTLLGGILEPDAALLTTIQEEHLEGLLSLENVARAEGELFHCVRNSGALIYPADEPLVYQYALPNRPDLKHLRFSLNTKLPVKENYNQSLVGLSLAMQDADLVVELGAGSIVTNTQFTYQLTKTEIDQSCQVNAHLSLHHACVPFWGQHYAKNALGAILVGLHFGGCLTQIHQALMDVPLMNHRMRAYVAKNHIVIDDCYNANPGSMRAAIDVLQTVSKKTSMCRVAILGDMFELGDQAESAHQDMARYLVEQGIDLAVFLGQYAAVMAHAAQSFGLSAEALCFGPSFRPLWMWLKSKMRGPCVILVKGSRGMKMEHIVKTLGVEN